MLGRIARMSWSYPWRVVGAALAVSLVAAVVVSGLRVDATFMGILEDDDPIAARLATLSSEFGASSGLLLVITGGTEAQRREGAQASVDALERLEEVVWAEAELDSSSLERFALLPLEDPDFERLLGVVRTGAPVLNALSGQPRLEVGLEALNDTVVEGFSARRAPEGAAESIEGLTGLVELLGTAARRDLVDEDLDALLPAAEVQGAMGLTLREGWLASADGEVYLVDVRTTLDPLHADIGMAGFSRIEEAMEPVRAANPALWMNFSGLLPGGFQDQQNVLGKVMPLSSLSLVLVLLALAGLDRRPTTPLLVGAGLLMAVLWTFALVRVVLGYASLTSTAFGILLFGLGVDYAVHIVVRFNDERSDGLPGVEAMQVALVRSGRGVVVGAVTTMTAFALMVLTDFKAATHLGITAAMGLGCALVVMVVVLPAALSIADQRGPPTRTRLELRPLDALVRACLAHPRTVLGVSAAVLVASLAQLPNFELETDLEKLITQDLPAMEANHIVAEAVGGSAEAVLSVHPDLETSRAMAHDFQDLSSVARVDGLHKLVPSDVPGRLDRNRRLQPYLVAVPPRARETVDVEALSAQLQRLRSAASRIVGEAGFAGRPDLADRARDLKAACDQTLVLLEGQGGQLARNEGFLLARLDDGVGRLRRASSLWSFKPEDLPEQLRSRYVGESGYLLYVYPTDYRIAWDFLRRYKAEVLSVDPKATGTLLVVDNLLVGGVDRLPFAMGAVLLSLVGILWLDLGRGRAVLVALVPLLVGSSVAIGVVIAAGMPISILMLSAFPLIFGIGIDDGVHILHRWNESEDGDVARAVGATGKAILFTSVTTALGFGILFLLHHRGLAGMATLVLLGVGTCFLTSVTLLPVLARLVWKK